MDTWESADVSITWNRNDSSAGSDMNDGGASVSGCKIGRCRVQAYEDKELEEPATSQQTRRSESHVDSLIPAELSCAGSIKPPHPQAGLGVCIYIYSVRMLILECLGVRAGCWMPWVSIICQKSGPGEQTAHRGWRWADFWLLLPQPGRGEKVLSPLAAFSGAANFAYVKGVSWLRRHRAIEKNHFSKLCTYF